MESIYQTTRNNAEGIVTKLIARYSSIPWYERWWARIKFQDWLLRASYEALDFRPTENAAFNSIAEQARYAEQLRYIASKFSLAQTP